MINEAECLVTMLSDVSTAIWTPVSDGNNPQKLAEGQNDLIVFRKEGN
jgi:hypothetical protein